MANIYLLIDGAQQGPFTEEQLSSYLEQGRISPNQQAWSEGQKGWVAVESLLVAATKPVEEAPAEEKRQEIPSVSTGQEGAAQVADIYLLYKGAWQGPFTLEKIRRYLAQGRITNEQRAYREGFTEWVAVETLLPEYNRPKEGSQAEAKSQKATPASTELNGAGSVADIYLLVEGIQQGPFRLDQLKRYMAQGRIANDQPARRKGTVDWVVVEGLLAEPDTPAEKSPAVEQVAVEKVSEEPVPAEQKTVEPPAAVAVPNDTSAEPSAPVEPVQDFVSLPIPQVPTIKKAVTPSPKSTALIAPTDTIAESPTSSEYLQESISPPETQAPTVPKVVARTKAGDGPSDASVKPSTPSESIQDSIPAPVADSKTNEGKKTKTEKKPKAEKKSSLKLGWKAVVGFTILVVGLSAAVVAAVWYYKPADLSHDDLTEMLRLHAAQPRVVETPTAATTSAAPPKNQQKVVQVDSNMRVNGVPIFSPVFQIESSQVSFNGGDYRNTVLDFRNTETKAFAMAEVVSDAGCYGTGDQKKYGIGVLLDENDRQVFFDENWVCYPGSLRKIDPDGPFATVFVVCTNKGSPAEGMLVEIGGMVKQTAKNGWAQFNLKNIQNQILTLKVTAPNSDKTIERVVALPISSASGKLDGKYNIYNVVYKTLAIELTQ